MPVQKTNSPQIQLCTEPWELVEADAFVCPINSEGRYSEYPALRFKELSGLNLDALVAPHTPLAIGAAFLTPAGRMRVRHLIHVPNTSGPSKQILVEDIARASAAAIAGFGMHLSALSLPV